jgi:hypothetical protein
MDGTHVSQSEKEKGCWYSVDELNTFRLAQAPLRPSSSDEQ